MTFEMHSLVITPSSACLLLYFGLASAFASCTNGLVNIPVRDHVCMHCNASAFFSVIIFFTSRTIPLASFAPLFLSFCVENCFLRP